jgi:hypothetical protein
MSDELFLAQFDLTEVSALVAEGEVEAAKKVLLAHYEQRTTPAWPAFPPTVTYRDKNVYELTWEELIAHAETLLAHRFVFAGMPEVALDERIDWRHNPGNDPRLRWTRGLHRHQWWAVLALAYARTSNERYAVEFVKVMLDWVKKHPPLNQKNEGHPVWTLMGVGMRAVVWTTAFGLFYRSPAFSDAAKLVMLRSIYDHAHFLYRFKTTRNHLLRESNGLAYLSLYFPEFKAAAHWRETALARLDNALAEQFNADGSHIEMSTGYQWLVVDEFEQTHRLLQAHSLSLPSEDLPARLEKMYEVLAHIIRPDGTFPQLNDGFIEDSASLLTRLDQAGETLEREDFIYVGTRGQQGLRPEATSLSFPDAGWYIMRSNWTAQAHYLLFDAGPYGGPHGHEDKLSLELSVFGQPFMVDSGSFTYNKIDPFRTYFVGSEGHNTVLVDGLSQVRRWQEAHLQPKVAKGNYATWISKAGFDYVAATYDDGYGSFGFQQPERVAITQATHTRRILFVKPDYWVVVDELSAATPHAYQLLFHAAPEIEIELLTDQRVKLVGSARQARLYLIPAEPQKVKLSCLTGSENPIQGWYSAAMAQRVPASTLSYEGENSTSAIFVTLLYPCRDDKAGDEARIKLLPVSGGEGLAVTVTTAGGQDYLLFAADHSLKQFGPYQSTGLVAGVRTGAAGMVVTQFEG